MTEIFTPKDIENQRLSIGKGMGLTHSIYSTWKKQDGFTYNSISEIERDFKRESLSTRKEIIKLAGEISNSKILKENDYIFIGLEDRLEKKPWLTEEEKEKYRYLISIIPDNTPEQLPEDAGKNTFSNTIKSIDELDINPNLQKKIINFMYDSYKNKYPLTIREAVRTKEKQQEYFDKGWSKTLNSLHLTGEAIDFRYNGDPNIPLEVRQIAARHGLFNGAEMWDGFDPPHFQENYTGNQSKKRERFLRMQERGTLPIGVDIPE